MKRIISLMSLAVLACGAATAQNTPYKAVVGTYIDASGALAVSDPSTSVAVDLIVEKEQTVVGPYARYAQKFLNMRGSLVDKTVYSLKGVKLAVTGGEDVIADAVPAAEVTETSYMGSASEFAKVLPDRMSATAVSEEEAAANAAQAIFSIRKHRMDLITGEAGENVFGAGLKDALAALDAAEQEYLELFFGKRVVTTSVERVVIPMIEGVQSYAVARISSSAGVIAADAKDGDAVTLEVAPSGRARLSSIVEADPKSKTAVKVRVADPSTCTVKVGDKVLTSAVLPLFEMGRTAYINDTSIR
ncbi:MAG TPA: DUF4831 family protein [Candidatus Alistipes merdipullorum]|nr:DUF4831 family protein [Candidatus Alistipes merdipullorum]